MKGFNSMKKYAPQHIPESYSLLKDVVLLGPRLMAASLEHAGRLVRLTSNVLVGRYPAHHEHHHPHPSEHHHSSEGSCCCEIPESQCPPRCVCQIKWEGRPGEHLKSTIRVTNTSNKPRNFRFTATTFRGPGSPQAPVTLSPASANLQPAQSTLIKVTFTPNQAFQAGQDYHAEVLIKGAYEQCVCFHFTALREGHAQCEVEQGDPPIRSRKHEWYDHFQCTEPCFPEDKPHVAVDEHVPDHH